MLVSASFLSGEYKPRDLIKKIDESVCDYIHVDIMDGKFLKNKTYTFGEVKSFVKDTSKKLDVHLMVNNPIKYIDDYAMLNVEQITFHYESVKDPMEVINYLSNLGIKCGMSIKPKTKIDKIFSYLPYLDLVLIMSVEPGASGQSFMENSLDRIKSLKEVINEKGYKTLISVDGGVNEENAPLIKESGADIIVSASYLHKNVIENSKILKNI
jgi:ribulose-phosphate 3-epimerase